MISMKVLFDAVSGLSVPSSNAAYTSIEGTTTRRVQSAKQISSANKQKPSPDRHRSLTLAERLKRVVKIDVSICSRCGGDADRRPVRSSHAWKALK